MLVGERMSHPVLTTLANVPVQEALAQMRRDQVRRYPVVNERGKLVGIVTDTDLLNAKPSDATTLSVWEVSYLLSKITVERVMAKKVITTTEDTPIEEAARIMADAKIGGLPVMRGDRLVGIITETDLFNLFLEMLGAREAGTRLTVEILDEPGKLHDLSGIICTSGGNLRGLGVTIGESSETRRVTVKVTGIELEALKRAIEPVVEKIIDIRTEKGGTAG